MEKKTIEHIRFTKVDAFKSHFIKHDGIFSIQEAKINLLKYKFSFNF